MARFKTQIQLGAQIHTVESDNFEEYLEIVGYLNVLAQSTEGRNAVLYAETRGGYNYKGWLDLDSGHKLDFGESMNPTEKSRRFFAYSPHSENYKGYVDGRGNPQPAQRQATQQAPPMQQAPPQQEKPAKTMQQKLDALEGFLKDAESKNTLEAALAQATPKVSSYTGNWKRQAEGILERYHAKLHIPAQQSPGDDLPF